MLAMLVIGIIGCCTHCLGPARAAEVEVTPALVCHVQDAIRWRVSPWTHARCAEVAAALNATAEPAVMLAIAVKLVALAHEAVQGA